MFYDNLLKLCAQRKESPSGVAKKIGLSNAAASGWKSGKKPSRVTLEKLSIYFGVPVEELEKEKPTGQEADGLSKYDMLNEENRAAIDALIDRLLASQSDE